MKTLLRFLPFVLVTMLASTAGHAAQLYRWVDANGSVEWRDTPPPSSVPSRNIQERRVTDSVIGGGEVPYSVQIAVKNHPVKLWTGIGCGAGCDLARAHLARRGVPYTESSPDAEPEAYNKASPKSQVPVLEVGKQSVTGYLESDWDNTLDSAGYPRSGSAVKPTIIKPPAAPPTQAAASKPAATAPLTGTAAPATK